MPGKAQTTGISLELDVDGGGGSGGDVNITEVGGVPVTSPLPVLATQGPAGVDPWPVLASIDTTGLATSAKQDTGNTSLASIDSKLTSPLTVQATNLDIRDLVFATDKVDVSGSTGVGVTGPLTDTQLRATPVPVSGTVTATIVNPLPVSSATLATAANQATEISSLASIKTNTDPLVASGGGGYVRQDSTATIAKETGGNLATIKTNTDSLPTPTAIFNGKTIVTTAGTRVTLAASQAVKSVTIKALSTNTDMIFVGNTSVASTNGLQLAASQSVSMDIANLNTVNLDSAVNGEGVTYLGIG